MARINPNFRKFEGQQYLFAEIGNRRNAFLKEHPELKDAYIRMGIGDTTIPLPEIIAYAMSEAAQRLSRSKPFTEQEMKMLGTNSMSGIRRLLHEAGLDMYTGYGDEPGNKLLRQRINEVKYGGRFDKSEIFVSDGAKCDTANIQQVFSLDSVVALQCPSYPVYEGSNVIAGRTRKIDPKTGRFEGLIYLECNPKNNFFPELDGVDADILYICSPNNPTGAAASRQNLEKAVQWARDRKAVIVFDSAYSRFITDPEAPHSIYEIDGAEKCAIEIGSFSKDAGFTGVRLGWSVVPKTLETEDYDGPSANWVWNKRTGTMFNGASNIVQAGGLAALTDEGLRETQKIIDIYRENAMTLRQALETAGYAGVQGGVNAPYVWFPVKGGSWAFLERVIAETQIECTPGAGFGGEGYMRLSGFASREATKTAADRIIAHW